MDDHAPLAANEPVLRRDARRNVTRIKAAAIAVFQERGLASPLEEIAQRAGVSVGTIYNRFGSRDALIDAVVPEVAAAKLDAVIAAAHAEPDAWARFACYLQGLFALQASDPALSDVIARAYPDSAHELTAVCTASQQQAAQLIAAAHEAGALRPDFRAEDLVALLIANAALVRSTTSTPDASHRVLDYLLDGLQAQASD